MSYIAYHKHTTVYLANHYKVRTKKKSFATYGAAQSAITREHNRGAIDRIDFLIEESEIFHKSIEKSETVINLLSGKPVVQPVNTPLCCDPSSETYHSM